MKKIMQISWLLVLSVFLFLPFPVFNIVKENIDTKNHEKRTLAEKPVLSLDAWEKFPSGFDAWMNDHLPFRNQLIAVRSVSLLKLFGESPSDKVIAGKDGWFFYNPKGKNEDPIADFNGTNLFSAQELEQYKQTVLRTQKKLADRGIEYVIFIAPNKEQMYGEKIPARYGKPAKYTRTDQVYDYLKDDVRIVYAKDALVQAKRDFPQYNFYYRLDTHWNYLGAYVGAKVLLKELGYDIPDLGDSSLVIKEPKRSTGDLVSMMGLQSVARLLGEDSIFSLRGYSANYAKKLKTEPPVERYETNGADERKVMMVRDSFTTALAPYLTSKFRETVLFPWNKYKPAMLEPEHPDIVIHEVVERYLPHLKNEIVE